MNRPYDETADRAQRQQQDDRGFQLQILREARSVCADDATVKTVLEVASELRVWAEPVKS